MPRKERPVPLSDSIVQFGAPAHRNTEAIPVRNTFIQFGASEGLADTRKSLTTAPAWIGPCFQSAMEMVVQSSVQVNCHDPTGSPSSGGTQEPDHDPLAAMGSPKKVPLTRYCLSSSSARAAGLSSGSTAGVTSSTTDSSLPHSGSGTGTTEKPDDDEVLDDEDDDASESGNENAGPRRQPVPPGELPSLGSMKHAEGLCKRCCFYPKGRCNNGYDCEFCHYEHEKRKRKKKKKGAKVKDSDSDAPCTVLSTPPLEPVEEAVGCDDLGCGLTGSSFLEMGEAAFVNFDPSLLGVPLVDHQFPRSMNCNPPTAPPSLPPQGVPEPLESPKAPKAHADLDTEEAEVCTESNPPAMTCEGQQVTAPAPTHEPTFGECGSFDLSYGGAGAVAFLLARSSSTVDKYGFDTKVPTYLPLEIEASLRAFATAGLQANGSVPPILPQPFGRPPPR